MKNTLDETKEIRLLISQVKLFLIIATEMMDVTVAEPVLMKALETQLPLKGETPKLKDRQLVKRILNQFRALDLVYSRWEDDRRNLFWGINY